MITLLKHTPISWFMEIIFNSISPFQRKGRKYAVNLEILSRISYSICLSPGLPPGLSQHNSSDRIQTRTLPILSPWSISSTSRPVGHPGFGKWYLDAGHWVSIEKLEKPTFYMFGGIETFIFHLEEEAPLKDENANVIFQDTLYFHQPWP